MRARRLAHRGFSDAVFAGAITLLVVSLEVSRTFDQLLFYVYPMKFLFILVIDELLGFGEKVRLPGGDRVEMIEPSQGPLLMAIYGGGFLAMQLVFVLLYLRATHCAMIWSWARTNCR